MIIETILIFILLAGFFAAGYAYGCWKNEFKWRKFWNNHVQFHTKAEEIE